MDESLKIRLISQGTFSDQDTLAVDISDSVWRSSDNRITDANIDLSSNRYLDNWIDACRRLRNEPIDFIPDSPYFNMSTFDPSLGGCKMGETWAMCEDYQDYFKYGYTSNQSCYIDAAPLAGGLPTHYAYPIYGIVFPVLVVLAIVANVFVMLVLSKRHMQSPTNIVLLYMSIADLTVGIVPLPFTFYWFTLRNFTSPWLWTADWCYVFHYLMDAFPTICHNVAIWLTVLLAAQRYVYIEFPLRAQSLCTIRNVRRASMIVVAISTMCGAMRFGDQTYRSYRGYVSFNGDVAYMSGMCLPRLSPVVRWYGGYHVYYDTYFWIRAIIFVWLPSLLLICLNVLLIRAIHRAQRRRDRLLSESRNREASRQKESNTTTTMLVIIVSIFLLVNCPQGLHIALITADEKLQLDIPFLRDESDGRSLALMIDNMLIIATYPLNFAIYCSMSTQFRDTFKHLFCSNLVSGADSTATVRTSSYYGYTPIGSRGGSTMMKNGEMQDSKNSSMKNIHTKLNNSEIEEMKIRSCDMAVIPNEGLDKVDPMDDLQTSDTGV